MKNIPCTILPEKRALRPYPDRTNMPKKKTPLFEAAEGYYASPIYY